MISYLIKFLIDAANIVIADKNVINENSNDACLKKNSNDEKLSSAGSSKNKRKFSIFAEENESARISFRNLEKSLDSCFNLFKEGSVEWLKLFKEDIIKNEFEKEPENLSYLPRSLTAIGSKILNLQIFWILWIESLKYTNKDISIQTLIDLYNQAFLNISEADLIKSYYLENIKRIDQSIMKEFMASKGVKFNNENSIITNDRYFELLDSFSQFLLTKNRSNIKTIQESSHKKKRSNNTENYLTCNDVTVTITSNPRREFLNTQISQNENFVYSTNSSKVKIAFCNCKIFL